MPRYALKIEYDGAPFAGWQRQVDHPSVQGAIEAALGRIEPGPHTIAAAGRTDAGVHALAQVAHCDLPRDWGTFRLSEALNYHLKPLPVAITGCARVPEDWHARFSATERQYLFRILSRRAPVTLDQGRVWHVRPMLDIDAMRAGAAHLIGTHDFTTFRSTICQAASPIKTLDSIEISDIPRPPERKSISNCGRGPFCTTRSAASLERSNAWGRDRGIPIRCAARLTPATAPPAVRFARPMGSISRMLSTTWSPLGRINPRATVP